MKTSVICTDFEGTEATESVLRILQFQAGSWSVGPRLGLQRGALSSRPCTEQPPAPALPVCSGEVVGRSAAFRVQSPTRPVLKKPRRLACFLVPPGWWARALRPCQAVQGLKGSCRPRCDSLTLAFPYWPLCTEQEGLRGRLRAHRRASRQRENARMATCRSTGSSERLGEMENRPQKEAPRRPPRLPSREAVHQGAPAAAGSAQPCPVEGPAGICCPRFLAPAGGRPVLACPVRARSPMCRAGRGRVSGRRFLLPVTGSATAPGEGDSGPGLDADPRAA